MDENKYDWPLFPFECNTAYLNIVVMKIFKDNFILVRRFESDREYTDWLCPLSTGAIDGRRIEAITIEGEHYTTDDCLDGWTMDELAHLDRSCRHAYAFAQALKVGGCTVDIPDRGGPKPKDLDVYECDEDYEEEACEEESAESERNFIIIGFGTNEELGRCATVEGAIKEADALADLGDKVEVRFKGKPIYVAIPKIADEALVNRVCKALETAFKDVEDFQRVAYATDGAFGSTDLRAFVEAVASVPMDYEYLQDYPYHRGLLFSECKTLINIALSGYVGRVDCGDGEVSAEILAM